MEGDSMKININDLCNELLLAIFSHFTALELATFVTGVCSRWRQLVNNDYLMWEHLWLKWDLSSNIHNYAKVMQSIPSLRCLELHNTSINELSYALPLYLSHTPNLEKLNLNMHISTLEIIQKYLTNLKYLRLKQITYLEDIDTLRNVTTFKISNAYNFCGRHLRKLALECRFLSVLSVVNAMSLQESDILYLVEYQKFTLEVLKIGGYGLSDPVLYGIAQCQNLKHLRIDDARLMTMKGILAIVDLPHLRVLQLSRLQLKKGERVIILLQTQHLKDVSLSAKPFQHQ